MSHLQTSTEWEVIEIKDFLQGRLSGLDESGDLGHELRSGGLFICASCMDLLSGLLGSGLGGFSDLLDGTGHTASLGAVDGFRVGCG